MGKLRELNINLKMKQRMILVYVLGCFLPLLLVYIFMFNQISNSLWDTQMSNQNIRLETEVGVVESAMEDAAAVSSRFYMDTESGELGFRRFSDEEDLKCGYNEFDILSEYLHSYYPVISSVSVYLDEDIVESKDNSDGIRIDNRHYKQITPTIMEKQWYKDATKLGSIPRWSYQTNVQIGQKSPRLARILLDQHGNRVGVISIVLSPEICEEYINSQDSLGLMLYKDTLIYSNFKLNEEQLEYILSNTGEDEYTGNLTYESDVYLTSKVNINSRYSKDYYSIILMTSDVGLRMDTRNDAIRLLLPFLGAMIVIAIAITVFNGWYSKRILALNKAMGNVTRKDYKNAEAEIGEARDEIWELYNDLNKMVADMREMDEQAANDKVMREQLYSRQRDVEFKMLAAQINPHFLYNTLENIRMLASINRQHEIEEIAVDLTQLLRSSLEAGGELRTLAWEMDKVERYIRIQDYRFGDRIHASIEYDKEKAEQYMVLPLVIQPFVENAYAHGMEAMESGNIKVSADMDEENGKLILIIEDDGAGMSEEELEELLNNMNDVEELDRTHIGVSNVNQRIRLRFGEEYGVKVTSTEGKGTSIKIVMPLTKLCDI